MTQAIILAAGKGTRCWPLTSTRPKPLLKIANRTIIEHNLEQLHGLVDEAIIVVGYKGEMIKEALGSVYGMMKLKYVEQKEVNGPGGALLACEKIVKERFLVMNGDDLYSAKDVGNALKSKYCVVVKEVDDTQNWGIVEAKNGLVTGFEEKPAKARSKLANIGLYVFDKKVFDYKLKKSKRGEYEITDYIIHLVKDGQKVTCIGTADYWIPIGYPWGMLSANEFLLKRMKLEVSEGAVIEKGATIKGNVKVGRSTIVKAGAYIEGPVIIGERCVIGPNCFIRGATTIGNGCKINNAVEVKNSIIFDNTHISHLSYAADSVIGENVNFGAGTIVANLRHDSEVIASMVNGELLPTGRRKFGTVLGDNVKTGVHTSIYPGRKIEAGAMTLPGEVVSRDKTIKEKKK